MGETEKQPPHLPPAADALPARHGAYPSPPRAPGLRVPQSVRGIADTVGRR